MILDVYLESQQSSGLSEHGTIHKSPTQLKDNGFSKEPHPNFNEDPDQLSSWQKAMIFAINVFVAFMVVLCGICSPLVVLFTMDQAHVYWMVPMLTLVLSFPLMGFSILYAIHRNPNESDQFSLQRIRTEITTLEVLIVLIHIILALADDWFAQVSIDSCVLFFSYCIYLKLVSRCYAKRSSYQECLVKKSRLAELHKEAEQPIMSKYISWIHHQLALWQIFPTTDILMIVVNALLTVAATLLTSHAGSVFLLELSHELVLSPIYLFVFIFPVCLYALLYGGTLLFSRLASFHPLASPVAILVAQGIHAAVLPLVGLTCYEMWTADVSFDRVLATTFTWTSCIYLIAIGQFFQKYEAIKKAYERAG